ALALLLELLGKPGQFPPAAQREAAQLVEHEDVVAPLGVEQQLFQPVQLLLQARGGPVRFPELVLQAVFFLAEIGECFLELGAIPVEVEQLVVVNRLFARTPQQGGQTGDGPSPRSFPRAEGMMARRAPANLDSIDSFSPDRSGRPQRSSSRCPWSMRYSSHLLSTMLRRQRASSAARWACDRRRSSACRCSWRRLTTSASRPSR